MGINLSKGEKINIGKTNITIGLGWTPNNGTGPVADLDVSLFMLNSNKIIPTDKHFIFFNNLICPNGAIIHNGDCRTGKTNTIGDDETIIVDTTKLSSDIVEIVIVVTIDDAIAKSQNFGMIRDSYIRIIDNNTQEEIAKYELDEYFSIEKSIEFGRLYLKNGEWKFDATGIGYNEELDFFVSQYYQGPVVK